MKFRVDRETPLRDHKGKLVKYTMLPYTSSEGTDEEMAKSLAAAVKRDGLGGQIVQLGKGYERIIERWEAKVKLDT